MKKEKLVWRLTKLPTTEELRELVKDKIISQEEAREILFSTETQEDRDEDSLKAEIKFLRELVDKLSNNKTEVVRVIKEIQKPYYEWHWYPNYNTWCSTSDNGSVSTGNTAYYTATTNGTGSLTVGGGNGSFTNIKTF